MSATGDPMQNWPEWRGPLRSGEAPHASPPVHWSEASNVKWKVEIPGSGSATPIIWGGQIFIQTAVPTGKKSNAASAQTEAPPADNPPGRRRGRGGMASEKPDEPLQFLLLCLDRPTGNLRWRALAREEVPHEGVRQGDGSFAAPSPVTDGEHVFAFFGSRGLYCYDLAGQQIWSRDLGKMRVKMQFGEGSSPTLTRDAVIVNWDNEAGSFIAAFDKSSGRPLWQTAREEKTSWSTPLLVEQDGKAEVVTSASAMIRSYDASTGALLWECGGLSQNVIPSPVAAQGLVYCMSGFQGNSLLAIRLGRTGDLTGTDAIAWSTRRSTPYVPSPLLYGGKLYFLAGNNGILSCLDATTGERALDARRIEGLSAVFASPIGAGGRVYVAGRDGSVVVLAQGGQGLPLAVNRLDDRFDASPAAAGRELFLRGRKYLYCLTEP